MDTLIPTGQLAPDFSLPDLDGNPHELKDSRGKITIINFWSAECPWAKRADEALAPLLQNWGEDVVLLSIAPNANEGPELLRQVAAERGISLVLHDSERQVTGQYGALTTPHIYVIDREGALRYQGAFDDVTFRQREATTNYLKLAVDALLAGQIPDPAEVPSYGCTINHFSME